VCEALSLILREVQRLREFDSRVLRNIFGSKEDEVTGTWRILHNEDLYNLNPSPNIIRVIKSIRIRLAWHVASMGGQERCIQDFGGKT